MAEAAHAFTDLRRFSGQQHRCLPGAERKWYTSHSIKGLRHNQSLLAYEMNGEPLPVLHSAPLRLRVENQLGFKQVKWIKEIEFIHSGG